MAYGLKYQLTFDDVFVNPASANKTQYRASIYKDTYVGSSYALIGTGNPVVIETIDSEGKSFNPIISKKATVNLVVDSNFNIEEFFDADDNDFKLIVETGVSVSGAAPASWTTLFIGLFVPVEQIVYSPVSIKEFSIVFNDGLSNLKEKKIYYDSTFVIEFNASETYSFKDILTNAFGSNVLALNYNVNWYYKNTGIADRELENMFVQKNAFIESAGNYLTWYNVLQGICRKFGFICHQKNGEYYLTSYGSLTRGSTRDYFKYNSAGTYQSTFTETDTTVTVDNSDSFKQIGKSLQVSLSKGNKSYTTNSKLQNVIQAVLNGDFSSWASSTSVDAWSGSLTYQRNGSTNQARFYTSQTIGLGSGSSIVSQAYNCVAGDIISVWSDINTGGLFAESARVILIPNDTTLPPYYWTPNGSFQEPDYIIDHNSFDGSTYKYTYIPNDGKLYVYIYQPYYVGPTIPNLYTYVGFFRIQYYGVNSSVQNFTAQVNEAAKDSLFNKDNETYDDITIFGDQNIFVTIQTNVTFNNGDNVAASRFISAWMTSDRSAVLNTWQRNGAGTTATIFELVSEDVGVDELYNQLNISGNFKSIGYDLLSKFSYSYATGVAAKNYILTSFRWDLRKGTQDVNMFAINFGLATNIVRNIYLNTNK
jgi:uncharacterized protein Usg